MNKTQFIEKLRELDVENKDVVTLYNEISAAAMTLGTENAEKPADRNAYYLSMEFLIGRSFYNNLMELGVLNETREILAEKGIDINVFEEIEDAALGNGGLGRLAACFLDSAAGLGLPLHGYAFRRPVVHSARKPKTRDKVCGYDGDGRPVRYARFRQADKLSAVVAGGGQ